MLAPLYNTVTFDKQKDFCKAFTLEQYIAHFIFNILHLGIACGYDVPNSQLPT